LLKDQNKTLVDEHNYSLIPPIFSHVPWPAAVRRFCNPRTYAGVMIPHMSGKREVRDNM